MANEMIQKITVKAETVKRELHRFTPRVPFTFPAMGWRFSKTAPEGAIVPENGSWACMFRFLERVAKGEKLSISASNPGCGGAACYLGFKPPSRDAGMFLADKEKYKKNVSLGNAFYDAIHAPSALEPHLVLERVVDMEDDAPVEVVNLWVDARSLAGLVTLANYDRPTNDNVRIDFASGCQSLWTIPFQEGAKNEPKAVVGGMDPAVRPLLPPDTASFSMPAVRFVEMASHIPGSFLEKENWLALVNLRPENNIRTQ